MSFYKVIVWIYGLLPNRIRIAILRAASGSLRGGFIVGAVAVIIHPYSTPDDLSVLLGWHPYRERKGTPWGLLGGAIKKRNVEDPDSPISVVANKAIVREIKEQTDLDIEVVRLLAIDETSGEDSEPLVRDFYFECVLRLNDVAIGRTQPSGEVTKLAWFRIAELPEDMFPRHKRFLCEVLPKISHLPDSDPFSIFGSVLVAPNVLRVQLPFPEKLPVEQYSIRVTNLLEAISFIYSVIVLLVSENHRAFEDSVSFMKSQSDLTALASNALALYNEVAGNEPLKLVSFRNGSPASIDLLGLGKALELLRDSMKDLIWRGEHEMKMAELERGKAETEIAKAKVETEKVAMEIAAQRVAVEKAKLENEKLFNDIVAQKFDLIQKATSLRLSGEDRELFISALVPKFATLFSLTAPTTSPSQPSVAVSNMED